MADNIAVTPGAGASIAADDIGGVLYQRTKLAWGVDGSAVDASASNPLPVTGTVTVNAGTNLNTSALATDAKIDTLIALLGGSGAPTQVWKAYNSTSLPAAGSAAAVWTPGGGKKIVLTSCLIASYGTTAYRLQLYIAASGDTTYSAGTDQAVAVVSFVPSASTTPGLFMNFTTPIVAATADYVMYVQADAAGKVDIIAYGYEI